MLMRNAPGNRRGKRGCGGVTREGRGGFEIKARTRLTYTKYLLAAETTYKFEPWVERLRPLALCQQRVVLSLSLSELTLSSSEELVIHCMHPHL